MKIKTEQPVVDIVRKKLLECGYPHPNIVPDSNGIIVYEQDSYKANDDLADLLKHGSKCSGKNEQLWTDEADYGKPEFVILNTFKNIAIVIECKQKNNKLVSKSVNEKNILTKDAKTISNYAVDGALHYAKYLSSLFTVIAIGVSANASSDDIIISTYIWEKNSKWTPGNPNVFVNMSIDEILPYDRYEFIYNTKFDKIFKDITEQQALVCAKDLNDILHKAGVAATDRALLISGLLLALNNKGFVNSYEDREVLQNDLQKMLNDAIATVLEKWNVRDRGKVDILTSQFRDVFIQKGVWDNNALILRKILKILYEKIYPSVVKGDSIDIIGKFYNEFLRYAKGEKSSGIVLTPLHITELFCDMVSLQYDDVVIDTCCGTGGFLITAMNRLFKLSENKPDHDNVIQHIKSHQLIGCDADKKMFALGCSNMILRGDGQANMCYDSCFNQTELLKSHHPTIGFINPPFSGNDEKPLEFVIHLCKCVEKHGKVCAVLPLSSVISDEFIELKNELLKNNKLLASIAFNVDLFRPVSTITCMIMLEVGVPHDSSIPTFLGNFENDGYVYRRNKGRIADGDNALLQKEKLIRSFKMHSNDEMGIWANLSAEDEWVYGAFLKTDYNTLVKEDYEKQLLDLTIMKLNLNENVSSNGLIYTQGNWKEYRIDELFEYSKGERFNKDKRIAGKMPFVTAGYQNSGFDCCVSEEAIPSDIFENVITIDMFGNSFYRPYKFGCDDNVIVLIPKQPMSDEVMIFIATTLYKENKGKFSYGRQYRLRHIEKQKILLPTKQDANGGYVLDDILMEKYIENLESYEYYKHLK